MTRLRHTIQIGAIAALSLAAGLYAASFIPDPDAVRTAPFVQAVKPGDAATFRLGTIKVISVEASQKIHAPRRIHRSGGNTAVSQFEIFLVPTIELTATHEPAGLGNMTITDRKGRIFGGPPPAGDNGCGPGQPGLPVRCQLVFEMPKDGLEGAILNVPAGGGGDEVLHIDLGINAEKAKQLASHSIAIRVYDAEHSWGRQR